MTLWSTWFYIYCWFVWGSGSQGCFLHFEMFGLCLLKDNVWKRLQLLCCHVFITRSATHLLEEWMVGTLTCAQSKEQQDQSISLGNWHFSLVEFNFGPTVCMSADLIAIWHFVGASGSTLWRMVSKSGWFCQINSVEGGKYFWSPRGTNWQSRWVYVDYCLSCVVIGV